MICRQNEPRCLSISKLYYEGVSTLQLYNFIYKTIHMSFEIITNTQ